VNLNRPTEYALVVVFIKDDRSSRSRASSRPFRHFVEPTGIPYPEAEFKQTHLPLA